MTTDGRATTEGIGGVPRCQACGRLKEKIEEGADVVVYECCDGVSSRPRRASDWPTREQVVGYG